jgi:hypothetical protein
LTTPGPHHDRISGVVWRTGRLRWIRLKLSDIVGFG